MKELCNLICSLRKGMIEYMKRKIEMNPKNLCFLTIIIVCALSLSYGIYDQVWGRKSRNIDVALESDRMKEDVKFNDLFDNEVHLQDYTNEQFATKLDHTKDIVYTAYEINESCEGKYEIQASIPFININNTNTIEIDKEISTIFYDKVNSILDSYEEDKVNKNVNGNININQNTNENKVKNSEQNAKQSLQKTVYNVSYTSYLNENILSLVIKAKLKEGTSAQRTIIKAYTYNISTNREISLSEMLNIKGIENKLAEEKIKQTIKESIDYVSSLALFGYDVYQRDMADEMYEIENSNNYFLGPDANIYIIYAYGNTNFTTESDIVYIE